MTIKYPSTAAQEDTLDEMKGSGFVSNLDKLAKISDIVDKLQVTETTIDLEQAVGTYDLFTGTAQDVIVDKLAIVLPNVDVSNDVTITSISIQTDKGQEIISAVRGAKANLIAYKQLGWDGIILVKVGSKIQLTIAGGAADEETVCDVVAEVRSVVGGGYLA